MAMTLISESTTGTHVLGDPGSIARFVASDGSIKKDRSFEAVLRGDILVICTPSRRCHFSIRVDDRMLPVTATYNPYVGPLNLPQGNLSAASPGAESQDGGTPGNDLREMDSLAPGNYMVTLYEEPRNPSDRDRWVSEKMKTGEHRWRHRLDGLLLPVTLAIYPAALLALGCLLFREWALLGWSSLGLVGLILLKLLVPHAPPYRRWREERSRRESEWLEGDTRFSMVLSPPPGDPVIQGHPVSAGHSMELIRAPKPPVR